MQVEHAYSPTVVESLKYQWTYIIPYLSFKLGINIRDLVLMETLTAHSIISVVPKLGFVQGPLGVLEKRIE